MEGAPVIAGLLAKRTTIEAEIADLEQQVRQRQATIRQVDAAICFFAPSLTCAKREVTRFQRSAHFVTGELTRRVQTAVREATGPITADEIAIAAMREKGLDMGGRGASPGHYPAVPLDVEPDAGVRGGDEAGLGSGGSVGVWNIRAEHMLLEMAPQGGRGKRG